MFYYLSKIVWLFLQPTSFLFIVLAAGLVLQGARFKQTRYRKAGYRMTLFAAIMLPVAGFSPLAYWLTIPLEYRFPQQDLQKAGITPDGIIVLGGVIDAITSEKNGQVALIESAERITEAVRLARLYPNAKIIFSGGSTGLVYKTRNEADLAAKFFADMGIDRRRILLERQSRNTRENAVFTKKMAQAKKGDKWLLITSAFHMPRSVGCFRKAGMDIIPWPVDYRSRGWPDLYRFFNKPSQGLRRLDLITKEWIGLVVYRLTGKTSAFFPK